MCTTTYKVTFPLLLTIEIEGTGGPAMPEIIRKAIEGSFHQSLGVDALEGTRFKIIEPSAFNLDGHATIRMAILSGDRSGIEIERA